MVQSGCPGHHGTSRMGSTLVLKPDTSSSTDTPGQESEESAHPLGGTGVVSLGIKNYSGFCDPQRWGRVSARAGLIRTLLTVNTERNRRGHWVND